MLNEYILKISGPRIELEPHQYCFWPRNPDIYDNVLTNYTTRQIMNRFLKYLITFNTNSTKVPLKVFSPLALNTIVMDIKLSVLNYTTARKIDH